MDGIYDWLYLYKFIALTLVILALSVLFIFVFRSKKWSKSTITIFTFIIIFVFVLSGLIYSHTITPYSYPCNIDKALVTELKDALDNYKDISKLSGVLFYKGKSRQDVMDDLNDYITPEVPVDGIKNISEFIFLNVEREPANVAEIFIYSSDDYIVYCTPISRDEDNMFFPEFYPHYYVNMIIVYKDYRIFLSDSSVRPSQADLNVALEKLITYLTLTCTQVDL